MGVSDEFYNFRNNYNIGTDLISSIGQRYRRITTRLNTDFWNTDSSSAHSLYVGSYGRDTAARGISDLDIGFQLPYVDYVKYSAYQGNGQSALLQAVKKLPSQNLRLQQGWRRRSGCRHLLYGRDHVRNSTLFQQHGRFLDFCRF